MNILSNLESSVLLNLAQMFDALQELADVSLSLQDSTFTLPKAHRLICRQIEVSRGGKERSSNCYAVAVAASSGNCFRGI